MANYPDLHTLLANPDKDRLYELHRSWRSFLGIGLLLAFSVLVVYLLNYFFHDVRFNTELPVIKYLSVRWLALIPIGILLELLRRRKDDLYIFGIDRLTHLNGRLSLAYSVPSIRYSHIRAITVRQTLIGRIFNYGDIECGTAAHEGVELTVNGVVDPYALSRLIESLRDYNREHEADAGESAQTVERSVQ